MPSGQVYELLFFIIPPSVVAKLCRLIKLLYSLERERGGGEKESGQIVSLLNLDVAKGSINKRFPEQQQASTFGKCVFNEMNLKGKIYYTLKMK